MSLTLQTWNLPPPNHLSGNQPVLTNHHRINSRSEQITEHCASSPLAYRIAMYCICIAIIVVYLLFLPPFFADRRCGRCRCCPLCLTTSSTTVYPYCLASRQAVPHHLSHILPICLYLSVAPGICCCYVTVIFYCIACHCRPLMYLPLSYAAYYIILFSSKPCAL